MRPIAHLPERQVGTQTEWCIVLPFGRGPVNEGKARQALQALEALGWAGQVQEVVYSPQDLT